MDTKKSLEPYPDYYYQTWARLPQYLVGILLGYIILNSRNRKIHWVFESQFYKYFNNISILVKKLKV